MTISKAFKQASLRLAQTGHKIFEPNWRHFRFKPGIVAVRPDEDERSVFLLEVHPLCLKLSGMQPWHHDPELKKELLDQFDCMRFDPRRFGGFRGDQWETLIEAIRPAQHDEFLQVTQIAQPEGG